MNISANVKHWHGTAKDSWFQHIAVEVPGEGTKTTWHGFLSEVRSMTGKKAVYMTHSQGGRVGWQIDTENVVAIVAIEPGFAPEVGSDTYKKFVAAKIPMIFYFGDYIEKWRKSKGL